MKIRLYLDEDAMDGDLVDALRLRGVDITTALSEGMIHRDDRDHLDYATSHGRVLYSFNMGDYLELHAEYLEQGKHHAGLILAQQQKFSLGEQMRRLLKIVNNRTAEAMQDQVEFLSVWG